VTSNGWIPRQLGNLKSQFVTSRLALIEASSPTVPTLRDFKLDVIGSKAPAVVRSSSPVPKSEGPGAPLVTYLAQPRPGPPAFRGASQAYR
jgi:hypothetical protein